MGPRRGAPALAGGSAWCACRAGASRRQRTRHDLLRLRDVAEPAVELADAAIVVADHQHHLGDALRAQPCLGVADHVAPEALALDGRLDGQVVEATPILL